MDYKQTSDLKINSRLPYQVHRNVIHTNSQYNNLTNSKYRCWAAFVRDDPYLKCPKETVLSGMVKISLIIVKYRWVRKIVY